MQVESENRGLPSKRSSKIISELEICAWKESHKDANNRSLRAKAEDEEEAAKAFSSIFGSNAWPQPYALLKSFWVGSLASYTRLAGTLPLLLSLITTMHYSWRVFWVLGNFDGKLTLGLFLRCFAMMAPNEKPM